MKTPSKVDCVRIVRTMAEQQLLTLLPPLGKRAVDIARELWDPNSFGDESTSIGVTEKVSQAVALLEEVAHLRAQGLLPRPIPVDPSPVDVMTKWRQPPTSDAQIHRFLTGSPLQLAKAPPALGEDDEGRVADAHVCSCGRGRDVCVPIALVCSECGELARELGTNDSIDDAASVSCANVGCSREGLPDVIWRCGHAGVPSDTIAFSRSERIDPEKASKEPAPGDDRLLASAPQVFRIAQASSGASAVIFAHVEREQLYLRRGFPTMKAYAAEELGVRSNDHFKKLRRAGKNAWELYPAESRRIIELASRGDARHLNELPALPRTTALAILKRAVLRTPESERAELLTNAANGVIASRAIETSSRPRGSQPSRGAKGDVARPTEPEGSQSPLTRVTDWVGRSLRLLEESTGNVAVDVSELGVALHSVRRLAAALESINIEHKQSKSTAGSRQRGDEAPVTTAPSGEPVQAKASRRAWPSRDPLSR
jgi:hypothetical protein